MTGSGDYVMTVDPGLTGTGICLWDGDSWGRKKVAPLTMYDVSPQSPDPENFGNPLAVSKLELLTDSLMRGIECCDQTYGALREYIMQGVIGLVIIEYPVRIFNQAIAERNTPAGIAFTAGAIAMAAHALGADLLFCDVTDWKGNMPKEAAWKQSLGQLSVLESRKVQAMVGSGSHCKDAFGIGMWAQGWF